VLEPPRHFARGRQQEREAAGDALLDDAELPVVELNVAPKLRQIAAYEREVMLGVDLAQRTDALDRRRSGDAAAQRIARIGRIGDDAARANDRGRLSDETRLRIPRMDGEVLSQ
jgi:hypothetical protein